VANVGNQMVSDILKYPLCRVALQGTVLSVDGGEMGLWMECAKRQVQPLYGIIVDGKATSTSKKISVTASARYACSLKDETLH